MTQDIADLPVIRREVRMWVRDVVAVRAFAEPDLYALIDRKALIRETVEAVLGGLRASKVMAAVLARVVADREDAAAAELAARRLN